MIRRFLPVLAIVVAVMIAIAVLILPPRPARASGSIQMTWPVVRGAYHVHSVRSDGTGTVDEIAAAAARAGLQFVIFTDHGDGSRGSPPAYRSGVLCIDGVEISTQQGHLVALDLAATPYRLAGHAADVLEDVHRFGGFGIAAHPDSPKADLRWSDWALPLDGVEWLNADSEWRDESWPSLAAALLTYPVRPAETLARLLHRPSTVIARWDALVQKRRLAALAAADAHARLGGREGGEGAEGSAVARLPSYEASFRTFANHVILPSPLTGEAIADGSLIMTAIREGHLFASIDGLGELAAFESRALSGGTVVPPGAYLDVTAPVTIEAAIAAPAGTTLALIRDGQLLYETRDAAFRVDVGTQSGAYRIEAWLPAQDRARDVPWLFANPMYVGLRDVHVRTAAAPSLPAAITRSPIATGAWAAEASANSTSTLSEVRLEDGTPGLQWQFTLAGGERGGQFAAMRFPVGGAIANHDRVQLRARSDRPLRVWAQLRAPGPNGPERWGKSFYVDPALSAVDLLFEDFRPFEPWSAPRPPLDRVDALLLVVDMTNSDPASAGRIAITDLWFAR